MDSGKAGILTWLVESFFCLSCLADAFVLLNAEVLQ